MKTENLCTAASRFALKFATELVGDKEPRLAKPAAVATRRRKIIRILHQSESKSCHTHRSKQAASVGLYNAVWSK